MVISISGAMDNKIVFCCELLLIFGTGWYARTAIPKHFLFIYTMSYETIKPNRVEDDTVYIMNPLEQGTTLETRIVHIIYIL